MFGPKIGVWMIAVGLALGWVTARPAEAQPIVRLLRPAPDAIVGRFLQVAVDVGPPESVSTVTGRIGSVTFALTWNTCALIVNGACVAAWNQFVSLPGLPRGAYDLTVIARDNNGLEGRLDARLLLDEPPRVTVTAPIPGRVARPSITIGATCADDDRCTIMRLLDPNGVPLATAAERLEATVSLAQFDGTFALLRIEATDSSGQQGFAFVTVPVESSPRLVEVFDGAVRILDVSADRLFVSDGYGHKIRDRASGRETVIGKSPGVTPAVGYLTPAGVLFYEQPLKSSGQLREWRAGALTVLEASTFALPKVKDAFAIWHPQTGGLIRRRLADGVNEARAIAGLVSSDLAPDGTVVYQRCVGDPAGCPIELLRTLGEPLEIARAPSGAAPVTDGTRVVFGAKIGSPTSTTYDLRYHDGAALHTLATSINTTDLAGTPMYRIAAGWTAFLRLDVAGLRAVWVRSPTGSETRLSAPGQNCVLDDVAPNGEVMFRTPTRRFLASPGRPLDEIGSGIGTVRWNLGQWYVIVGGILFAVAPAGTTDLNADGVPDDWSRLYGLDPMASTGSADADGDGLTNLQEFQRGTHPTGFNRRYFAEGAASAFFDTSFALVNTSGSGVARVQLRYLKDDGATASTFLHIAALTRRTVSSRDLPSLASSAFSTVVESNEPVAVDRTMTWDATGYGAHGETGIAAPAMEWFLAEGATHSGFDLFYLIQNPNDLPADVKVTYLLVPPAAPLQRTYRVPANTRFTVWINQEAVKEGLQALASAEVSARLQSDRPIIVERAMYLSAGGLPFGAGHASAGVTGPALRWFLAEGATGEFFDEFLLIANPNTAVSTMTVQFLLSSGGAITRTYNVPGNSRATIWVDTVDPALANAAVSAAVSVTNGVPVVVERAMWWPGPSPRSWIEAHNSAGVTETGTAWALADGEQGGARNAQTYILVANTFPIATSVKVTLLFEDSSIAERTFQVNASSRFTVDVGVEFASSRGRRFGAIVESSSGAQIIVERAMYADAHGVTWAAGTNAVATRLR